MPTVFACVAILLIVIDQFHPLNPLATALACGTIIALVWRLAVTLAENLRMVASSRARR
jgi:hypothetical protein